MRVFCPQLHVGAAPAAPFAPRRAERLMRLTGDVRLGLPVVLTAPDGAVLAFAVETLTEPRLDAAMQMGRPDLILTRTRARSLGLVEDGGEGAVRLHPQTRTLMQLRALADPATDPGAPLALPDGAAGGDLVHDAGIALVKAAQLLPALLSLPLADPHQIAEDNGLSVMAARDVLDEIAQASHQAQVSVARLPMAAFGSGRLHVFRSDDDGQEHYAIEVGTPDLSSAAGPVLVRLHSACFTGDVLGSLKCDCGPQLHAAMAAMAGQGGGVLLYLNQEGRGIGLANKMRAYALQDQGLDTVEANHHLGFEDDERDFRVGAALLARMGVARVRLMTNNPAKVAMLGAHGIEVVDRVPLRAGQTPLNANYLATKAHKSGHLLP